MFKRDVFSRPRFRVEAPSCLRSSVSAEETLDDSWSPLRRRWLVRGKRNLFIGKRDLLMTASRPCDADGFPFRLPNTNVPSVWKLVAILAEQAHVVHCTTSKMLLRCTRGTSAGVHACHGVLKRKPVVLPLLLQVQAGIEIKHKPVQWTTSRTRYLCA